MWNEFKAMCKMLLLLVKDLHVNNLEVKSKKGWKKTPYPSLPGCDRCCPSGVNTSPNPSPSKGDSLPISQSLSPASLSPRPLSFRLNLSISLSAYLQNHKSGLYGFLVPRASHSGEWRVQVSITKQLCNAMHVYKLLFNTFRPPWQSNKQ